MQFLLHNVHCNTLHSNCSTNVHLLWSIFHWTHLRPPPLSHSHSHLALISTNLTAAQNSYRRYTQQALPNATCKVSVPAAACLYLTFCAQYILFSYFKCSDFHHLKSLYFLLLIIILTSALYPNTRISYRMTNTFLCLYITLSTMSLSPQQRCFLLFFPSL